MAVGVLALQGSFNEHMAALRRIGVKGVEIRKPEQLAAVDALIIPGGESTTMAKLANYQNLFPALREFVNQGKPVWGTCAGLIFLANKAIGQKSGGQEFIGGLDCTVHRNFFGSQIQSFETELAVPKLAEKEGGPDSFRAVFIRAPAVLEAGPDVEVLADYPVPLSKSANLNPAVEGEEMHIRTASAFQNLFRVTWYQKQAAAEDKTGIDKKVIVALRQGNILGTAFHPELTSDTRWHTFFLKMGKEGSVERSLQGTSTSKLDSGNILQEKRSFDLPIVE